MNVLSAGTKSSSDVFEELKERERRETSIIIHRVLELNTGDKKDREDRDLRGVQQLFNMIGVDLEVSETVKFTRREGEVQPDQPRPLKVVLRRKDERDLILSNVYKLNKSDQESWRRVTVVSDLTRMQRSEEGDMRKLAASKKLISSQEEIDKGEAWKVVGKRGAKRLQLVKLYRDEIVTETGEVKLTQQVRGEKRGRSSGNSPSQVSRPRIQPENFFPATRRSPGRRE